jgi:hypothetical protein
VEVEEDTQLCPVRVIVVVTLTVISEVVVDSRKCYILYNKKRAHRYRSKLGPRSRKLRNANY